MDNCAILIAEDDEGHFALVKRNLWRTCITREIVHFRDGDEILDFLFENGNISEKVHYVILLDIRLPKTDGIEVLRRIKEDPELKKVPVIMLTTSSDVSDIDKCYELGCSAYIIKPCDYTGFMESVESLGRLLSLPEFKWPQIDQAKVHS